MFDRDIRKNKVIDSCLKCPDYASCKSPCEKISKELEKIIYVNDDESTLQVSNVKTYEDMEKDSEESTADNIRKIDPAAIFSAETDTEAQWDAHEIIMSDMEDNDYKKIGEYLSRSVPDLKLRRRFYKYLGCDKLSSVAERAGVSKQNIQKQFTRIIKITAKMISGKDSSEQINLPRNFKKMYFELKPADN